MTTQEIADRTVALNREGNSTACYDELYSLEAVSIENWGPEPERYEGLDAIRAKAAKWADSLVEIHSVSCSEPLVADKSFAITFTMDATYKDMGRVSGTELAVYTVVDGKIVKEDFQG